MYIQLFHKMNKIKYSQIYIMALIESLKACNERLFDNEDVHSFPGNFSP